MHAGRHTGVLEVLYRLIIYAVFGFYPSLKINFTRIPHKQWQAFVSLNVIHDMLNNINIESSPAHSTHVYTHTCASEMIGSFVIMICIYLFRMVQLLKQPGSVNYVDLTLSFQHPTDPDQDSLAGPPVRYFLK